MNSWIRLKYGRGVVLEPFLNRVYGMRAVRHLVLVSPWMTHLTFRTGDTRGLLARIGSCRARLTVVTRQPEQDEHREFVDAVCCLEPSEVFYVPDLHAKYYVCHTRERSFAVVGSPNMYRWTSRSFEVGVLVESRGDGEILISELDSVTYDLKTSKNRRVHKRIGG